MSRGISPRPELGAKRPYRPKSELRFSFLVGCSGVSSLSALSGEEKFSAPDEKSMSTLRGVVKAVLLKIGLGEEGVAADGILEKRKGWEIGSRRDGKGFLVGDSKAV